MFHTVFLLTIFLFISSSYTIQIRWIGLAGDPYWDNPKNWYCTDITRNCTPTSQDDVLIDHSQNCTVCMWNIVVGPSAVANCRSLQMIGKPGLQSTLTILTNLTIWMGSSKIDTNSVVIVVGHINVNDGSLSTAGTLVCSGGFLNTQGPSASITIHDVNLTSTCTFGNKIIILQDIVTTPPNPDLDCAIFSSDLGLTINGSIASEHTLSISGAIVANGVFYHPLKPTYSLTFHYWNNPFIVQKYNYATFYIGGVIGNYGNLQINLLTLVNGANFVTHSLSSISNVNGNGFISAQESNTHVYVNISNPSVHVLIGAGSTLTLGGQNVGNVTVFYQGRLVISGNRNTPPILLDNLEIISGGYLSAASIGTKAQTRILTLRYSGYVSVFIGIELEVRSAGNFEGSVTLTNSILRIGPSVTVRETSALNFDGNGNIVMDGMWINTSGQPYVNSVTLLGTGTWSFSLSSFTFATPLEFTGFLNVTNSPITLRPVPGIYSFSHIFGIGDSKIDAVCDKFIATDVNVPAFNDYTTISLEIENANIARFTCVNKGNKSIKSGKVGTLMSSPGAFNVNLNKTDVENLTMQTGNVVVAQAGTVITNLNFFGGTLWQQANGGIFKVSNATYLGTAALKALNSATTLVTNYLDCRQCGTPDCGFPLTDWSRIQYSSSSGCLI